MSLARIELAILGYPDVSTSCHIEIWDLRLSHWATETFPVRLLVSRLPCLYKNIFLLPKCRQTACLVHSLRAVHVVLRVDRDFRRALALCRKWNTSLQAHMGVDIYALMAASVDHLRCEEWTYDTESKTWRLPQQWNGIAVWVGRNQDVPYLELHFLQLRLSFRCETHLWDRSSSYLRLPSGITTRACGYKCHTKRDDSRCESTCWRHTRRMAWHSSAWTYMLILKLES